VLLEGDARVATEEQQHLHLVLLALLPRLLQKLLRHREGLIGVRPQQLVAQLDLLVLLHHRERPMGVPGCHLSSAAVGRIVRAVAPRRHQPIRSVHERELEVRTGTGWRVEEWQPSHGGVVAIETLLPDTALPHVVRQHVGCMRRIHLLKLAVIHGRAREHMLLQQIPQPATLCAHRYQAGPRAVRVGRL